MFKFASGEFDVFWQLMTRNQFVLTHSMENEFNNTILQKIKLPFTVVLHALLI